MANENHWHLDKRVPISLIGAILVQTAAFGWLLASMNAKIDDTHRRTEILEARADERSRVVNQNTTSIAVINESLRNMESSLRRIESAVTEKDGK